jgi:hypothetical protein
LLLTVVLARVREPVLATTMDAQALEDCSTNRFEFVRVAVPVTRILELREMSPLNWTPFQVTTGDGQIGAALSARVAKTLFAATETLATVMNVEYAAVSVKLPKEFAFGALAWFRVSVHRGMRARPLDAVMFQAFAPLALRPR